MGHTTTHTMSDNDADKENVVNEHPPQQDGTQLDVAGEKKPATDNDGEGGTSRCCLGCDDAYDEEKAMENDTTTTCLDGNLWGKHEHTMSKTDEEIFGWWKLFIAEIIFC